MKALHGLAAGARLIEPPPRVSCVVCAYNEAERLETVLSAIRAHPGIGEIIVVNDGSTDGTEALLSALEGVRAISYAANRGKTYALAQGVMAARGDLVMLIDADLAGLSPADIDALLAPVLNGEADASISLRANSLWIYRVIGLDFVSGERVLPGNLLRALADEMERRPPWGGEACINDMIIRNGLRLAIVDWPGVCNIRKHSKVGAWRGALDEVRMIRDALAVLGPLGVLRQNLALLRLARRDRRATPGLQPGRRPAIRGSGASGAVIAGASEARTRTYLRRSQSR